MMAWPAMHCDNCDRVGTVEPLRVLPYGWVWTKGGGSVLCDLCKKEEAVMNRDLERLGTIGPVDPTP